MQLPRTSSKDGLYTKMLLAKESGLKLGVEKMKSHSPRFPAISTRRLRTHGPASSSLLILATGQDIRGSDQEAKGGKKRRSELTRHPFSFRDESAGVVGEKKKN